MVFETKKLAEFKNGNRLAIVKTSSISNDYDVWFYYDGMPDYEWKKGSHGIAMDICKTLEQAKKKAKYYVNK